jgi:hypothetical protein
MLFGTGRISGYSAIPQDTGVLPVGTSYTFINLSNSTNSGNLALPVGSQAGDLCIYSVVRNTGSQGTAPTGFSAIDLGSLSGGIGYHAIYGGVLSSSNISTGSIDGVSTNIVRKWALTFRPPATITDFLSQRLISSGATGSTLTQLTMTGTFTRPSIVIANAVTVDGTFTTGIDITNGSAKTSVQLGNENSLTYELVGSGNTDTARTTNQAILATSKSYRQLLVSIRGI